METQLATGAGPSRHPEVALPTFDLHRVEVALRTNHLIFGGTTPMTQSEIDDAIRDYRAFFADHKAAGMPEQFEVPSVVVDRVWYSHMCETRQYAADCDQYFGRMFHHSGAMCSAGGDD